VISALAAISRWDVRFAQGMPRPLSTVAADYQRKCASKL